MNPAPARTQKENNRSSTVPTGPLLTNPALDQAIATFETQSRELDASFKLASNQTDLQLAVRSELLEAIDRACTPRVPARPTLFGMTRC